MALAPLPPPHEAPHAPRRITVPANACDSHCHIFGPPERFPYLERRTYEPPATPLERYQRLQAALGLTRAVFVQPAVYGSNHDAIVDALERGEGRYAAVGIIDDAVDAAELQRLHQAGMRGARFNYFGHLGARPTQAQLDAVIDRVVPLGWHLVFHVDGASLIEMAETFAAFPFPIIIDHMARFDIRDGQDQPAFRALLALAAMPHVWVKISAADRMVGEGQLADVVPFMARTAETAPERTLWGTDWPHPNVKWMPDDGDVLDLLADAVPDEAARSAILVDNPAKLYAFR